MQDVKGSDRDFVQRGLHDGANHRALRRNRSGNEIDGPLGCKALDLGDILVTDGHRALRLVTQRGGAALVEFHQELAIEFQRSEELLQCLEHPAISQMLVYRAQSCICRLHVADVDLRIDEISGSLRCSGTGKHNEQRGCGNCAHTVRHRRNPYGQDADPDC